MRLVINLSWRGYWNVVKWVLGIALLALFLYFAYTITRPTLLEFYVYDGKSGAVLPDAVLEVQNANGQKLVQLVTDAKGWAGVKRLVPGTEYRVVARHIDYVQTEKRGVDVKLHKTVSVRMPLRAKPGGRLYVGMERAYVAAVDTASYLFVGFKKGPEKLGESPIQEILLHPERPWLYISTRYRSYILNESGLQPMAELAVSGAARNLHLSQDGKRLWATLSERGGRVAVLDAYSGTVASYVNIPFTSPNVQIVYSNTGPEAYVLDGGSSVGVIDVRTGSMLARIPLRLLRPTWAALSADETQLYLGSPDNEQMFRLDTRQRQQVTRPISIGQGISAIAVHPGGKELYLANGQLGLLLVLDTATQEVLANIPVGRKPVAVAVDTQGERVYVANADSQDISVLDVQTREIVETIKLELAPLCLAVR